MPKIVAMSSTSIVDVFDGNSVVETIVEYAVSSDGRIPPGNPIMDGSETITDMNGVVLTDSAWSTEIPTITEGQWLWTRTRTIYSDGQFTIVYTVSRSGNNGAQGEPGVGYTAQKEQWYLSTSPNELAGGSWLDDEPSEIPDGKYLWGRIEYTMSDGSTRYSNAVYRSMISGLISLADEVNKKITQKVWSSDIEDSIDFYDGSTGKSIRDRVAKTETDIDQITSQVSDISSELDTKADGSTVITLQQTVSTNEQTASQFRQTVQSDYAKLTDVDTIINNIKIGGNNLYVIKDETPGYIHGTSGAIVTPSASVKEVTSSFIPVKPGESYILQSWATPTTSGKSWLAYQYYSDNSGTPFGQRVSKYGDTSDSGVEVTADGQEHLTYKISIPEGVTYLRMSYRKYDDGYAMIEKATTPSEYAINPEDLQNYTDSVVSSAKSEIKQTTDSINLEVSKKVGTDEVISSINASTEGVTIQASKINLLGQVTFEMLNNAAQTRITNVESNANLANDKSNQTLAMKVNYSAFSTSNNGECYIHGFDENHEPADVNGYIYWKGRKITVAKTMINPGTICPYYKTIYLVLRLSSTTATAGTLYMVWYNSGWKCAVTPTPSAVGGTWTWNENTDIAIGQFVEPGSDLAMVDTYLYYPPRSANEIVSTADNAYGYAKGAVNWVSSNGTNITNALSMIKKWTNNAVSDTTTIQGGWIATNTITSSQLATNAIMSTNYEASSNVDSPYSATGTFLDLSNGNFWTPNFGVINITPTGTHVPTGAWFNGTVYANAGRFGEGSSYWNIETVTDYEVNTHAALVGTGNAYLQTGNWQVNDNAVQTRKYMSTAEYSGQTTYYKDTNTNTYYDVGMKIPTDFSQRTSSDDDVATYNKSFFYGRKYTGNNLPSLDSEWTYFFQVDSQGNIYECGQPLNARYAAIGDVQGQYVSTTGGTVNGNLTVTGTLTATASNATKVGHSLSINNKSFDGSATVDVGTIGVAYGGTGKTSWTANRIVYASATNTLNQLGAGTSGQLLRSNGSSAPGWVDQSSIVAGSATNATNATNDANGDKIDTTYRKLSDTAFPNGLTGNVTGNVSGSAGSVKNNLIIKLNGGTTEGTDLFTYNGSAKKTINITGASLGLSEASTHGVDTSISSGSTSSNLPTTEAVVNFVEGQNYGVLGIAESSSNGKITVTTASGTSSVAVHGLGSWAYKSSGSAGDVGLGNVTNNKQVKGLSSGTTSGHLVSWGADGYTVADSGVTAAGVKKTVTTLASNDDGKIVLTYLDGTTSDPIEVKIIGQSGSSVSYADALNVNGAAVGSASKPVFINAQGKPQQANTIPTITLNGTATTSASFYAPTTVGSNNQYLKSNGNGAPTWATFSKSTVGLGNVDNTADANKAVLTATKFANAQSVTLTGDTTGTASSQAGWSIATTTNKLTSLGRLKSANVDNTSSDYKNKISYFYSSSLMTEGKPPVEGGILNFAWDSSRWGAQLAIKIDTTPHIYIRGGNSTSWDENWLTALDSNNYNNYSPTLEGTGATGTWNISVSGVAATATNAINDSDSNPINTTYAKLSGATFTGAVTGTSFSASSYIAANSGNSGAAGGIALYGTTPTTYGIAMRQTSNGGKHGHVQGDWAIYSYMNGADNRGWILKNNTKNATVASVDNTGNAAFNGEVSIGISGTNIDGSCSLVMNKTLGCLDFVFN